MSFALSFFLAPGACRDSVTNPSPAPITEITLDWRCFCRPDGYRYELRLGRDELATCRGNCPSDRRGSFTGKLDPADYESLARLLESKGFFEFKEEYGDRSLQDGDWLATGAVREGRRKLVWNQPGSEPPNLQAIQRAIDSLRARIDWVEAKPQTISEFH